MRKISYKRLFDLSLLILTSPGLGWMLAAFLAKLSHKTIGYPENLDTTSNLSIISLVFAYPLTTLLIIPAEKLRKNLGYHPLVFFTISGAGFGLLLSALLSELQYVPGFTYFGICYGFAIGFNIPREKNQLVSAASSVREEDKKVIK